MGAFQEASSLGWAHSDKPDQRRAQGALPSDRENQVDYIGGMIPGPGDRTDGDEDSGR
jgi:hypothetical protein